MSLSIAGSSSRTAWFYAGGSTSRTCNNIKTDKCQPGLTCPATLTLASTKPPPKKKKRVGHRRHARMLLSE